MDAPEAAPARSVVLQPDEGPSWWQPRPAGGHAQVKVSPGTTGHEGFSMGFQTIAPGGRIRAHSHGEQVEVQVCFRGRGHVVVDGETFPFVTGTTCFLGTDAVHEIVNDDPAEDPGLVVGDRAPTAWRTSSPPSAGPRAPGEPPPEPFDRPADVLKTERRHGLHAKPGQVRD